jgi:hypothetical protein
MNNTPIKRPKRPVGTKPYMSMDRLWALSGASWALFLGPVGCSTTT